MSSRRRNLIRARLKGMLVRKRKRKVNIKPLLFLLIIILTMLIITKVILNFVISDVEPTKDIYIPHEYLKKAYNKANEEGISFSKLLAHSASEANFLSDDYTGKTLRRAVKAARANEDMNQAEKKVFDIYSKVFDDLKVGPIPERKEIFKWDEIKQKWEKVYIVYYNYTSVDDFGADRTYGGDREHEGNDLIADMRTPIVSMTDGEITRIGWNEYGGLRIGITSNMGTYFYYAHMDSYAEGMTKGKRVKAGDVIGYIGDTGYGPPGTRGKFTPHLHLQIGIKMAKVSKDYTWFNPYDIVKFLDDHRVTLIEKK